MPEDDRDSAVPDGGGAGMRVGTMEPPGISVPSTPAQGVDAATLAEYLRTIRIGSTITVERIDGRSMRATLLKVTDRSLTVQEKTRIPEPAVEIPLTDILRVTPAGKNGHSIAKAIGIGAAAAGGAVLGIFLILVATCSS